MRCGRVLAWVWVWAWACIAEGGNAARVYTQDLERPGRIVGGKEAREGEYPWTVSVQWMGSHFCCGTLIAKDWVITAAHCMRYQSKEVLKVVTGTRDIKSANCRKHRVVYVKVAPYNPDTHENDIAIMRIEEEDRSAARLDLPSGLPIAVETRTEFGVGDNVYISGWGKTAVNGKSSPVLIGAEVKVQSDEDCKKAFLGVGHIHESNLCAGGAERDACQGDSGGPLVYCDDLNCLGSCRLMGVTSWGIGCATPNLPGVYTEVAHYKKFIEDAVKESGSRIDFYDGKNKRACEESEKSAANLILSDGSKTHVKRKYHR